MTRAAADTPALSVVVPTLNEAFRLPLLLQDLLEQRDVLFEVLLSDGGSEDGTCRKARELLDESEVSFDILTGSCGRGRQLNRAVRSAKGEWLLFLHADSRLPAKDSLARALQLMGEANPVTGPRRVAGRFALEFEPSPLGNQDGLFFCEAKARLGERGCIHGDQGFILSREFFGEVGPFREDLPVMEDTWMAEVVREKGRWLLLPVPIRTSPRRFEVEGFGRRQVLNALLMNFLFVGWDEFLRQAPAIYRRQDQTGKLHLLPFWREIRQRLSNMSWRRRWRLWFATGGFVRSQAWQIVFWREARRCRRKGRFITEVDLGVVRRFQRWFEPLTGHPPGAALAGLLTWFWFHVVYFHLCRQRE